MIGWTQMERTALTAFIDSEGPVRNGLVKFTEMLALHNKELCATHMNTVPRNFEAASDYAAQARVFDEFWMLLADAVRQDSQVESEPQPT